MRYDTWLTLSGSEMDFKAITSADVPGATFGGKLGRPAVFLSHTDPEGRFLLRYPEGWTLQTGPPVEARSKRLPMGARVDIHPGPDVSWDALRASVTGPGGLLVDEKRMPGPPRQIRGQVVAKDALIQVRALAFPFGAIAVVLSTGMAPAPNPGLERYGRALLAAVRREFRVPAPLPPG